MNVTLGVLPAIDTSPLTTIKVNTSNVKPVTTPTATASTSTTKKPIDLTKVQQGVDIFQDIFSTFKSGSSGSGSGYNPAPASQPAPGLSTAAKVGIGAGAALLGYIVYKSLSKKKSKSLAGLGELNTAKTAKKRVAQRAAVFAKLDEEGKTYPKNKSGVRKPVRKAKKAKARRVKI